MGRRVLKIALMVMALGLGIAIAGCNCKKKDNNDDGNIIVRSTLPPVATGFQITEPSGNTSGKVRVSWSAPYATALYDLKVGSDDACITAVQEYTDIDTTYQVLTDLDNGKYYICLTASETVDDGSGSLVASGTKATPENYGQQFDYFYFWLGRDPDGRGALDIGMYRPTDVASDGTRLAIVDKANNRVMIWNAVPADNNTPADLVIGQPDLSSRLVNHGGLSAATLSGPSNVAFFGSGLVISDTSNNRVLIWNTVPTTNFQAADVVVGQADFASADAATTATGLEKPWFVDVFDDHLFVSDFTNNRILIWNSIPTSNGAAADLVIGQNSMTTKAAGCTDQDINGPGDLAYDGTRLYLNDYANNRILIYNSLPTTNYDAADLVIGQDNMTSCTTNGDGSGTPRQDYLEQPWGVTVSGTKMIVSDNQNHRVLIWNTLPMINTASPDVVVGQDDWTSQNTGTLATRLNEPYPASVIDGNLYIPDRLNNRVLVFNGIPSNPPPAPGAAASYAIGQASLTDAAVNYRQTSSTLVKTMDSVATDGEKIFGVEFNSNRVLVWNTHPASSGTAPDLVLGQPDFTSMTANDGGPSASTLNSPYAVLISTDQLYLSDTNNHRILGWDSLPDATQQAADFVVGQGNFTTVTADTNAGGFNKPALIATDGARLIVPEYANHRVLIWDAMPTSNQDADMVLGQTAMDTSDINNGGSVSATGLNAPWDVATNGTQLAVADYDNFRVLIWTTFPTTDGQAADVVIGQPNMTQNTADNGGVSASSMNNPWCVHIHKDMLLVCDSNNYRVLVWDTIPSTDGAPADRVLGQTDLTSNDLVEPFFNGVDLPQPTDIISNGDLLYISDSYRGQIQIISYP